MHMKAVSYCCDPFNSLDNRTRNNIFARTVSYSDILRPDADSHLLVDSQRPGIFQVCPDPVPQARAL